MDAVWTRQDGETSQAYGAFQEYLRQGSKRSTRIVAENLDVHQSMIRRWSAAHDWVARSAAYDSFVMSAPLDGMICDIAAARDKSLALTDKLRDLLDARLDDFIAKRDDPTIRWTQALVALARVEQNYITMGLQEKTSTEVARVEKLLQRLEEDMEPAE